MNLELLSHEFESHTRRSNERFDKIMDQLDKIMTISEKSSEQIGGLIELARNHENRIHRLEA